MIDAIQLTEPGKFERILLEEPTTPGPDEALVRVYRVGVCGSDVSGYLGKMPFYSYPRIPGHELGIEVLSIGQDVTNVVVGDHCSVEPYLNCQHCLACRRGCGNCCEHLQVLGVHTDGGLRTAFLVPARKLHQSSKLTFEQLALVETLAIGCHCVDRAAPEADDHVFLIGAGPIGLAVIEFLKLIPGIQITVMDISLERLDFCRQTMGVHHTIPFVGDESERNALRKITDGSMARIVIDATGNAKSMSGAVDYLSQTGRLVYVGIATEAISFPHSALHVREATIMGSRNALPSDFERIIRLIEEEQIDTRPWVTHRTPFDDMIENFPTFTKPESGVIKAIIELDN